MSVTGRLSAWIFGELQGSGDIRVPFCGLYEQGTCKFFKATTGKPNAGGSYKVTPDQRLQLHSNIRVTGSVPTPQSELSGATAYGRFVWRGVVYQTDEVTYWEVSHFEKTRRRIKPRSSQILGFYHPKRCDKAPNLAVCDGLTQISEAMVMERGYIVPITRNLHFGDDPSFAQPEVISKLSELRQLHQHDIFLPDHCSDELCAGNDQFDPCLNFPYRKGELVLALKRLARGCFNIENCSCARLFIGDPCETIL